MGLENQIEQIRQDFPLLQTLVHGKQIVYVDNAATTQKPIQVIQALDQYYRCYNSNVHRGVHELSQIATAAYEGARESVADLINAGHTHEIIFTKGTTEGINLVASTWGRKHLRSGQAVLISAMEHHSNIVPWQMACEAAAADLRVIPMNEKGELELDKLSYLLDESVSIVAITMASNSLGTINPVSKVITAAHALGIPVLLDAAQMVQHMPLDVRALDADFVVFSGHKMYGPTGIGVLYGKEKYLQQLPPYQGGGDMIRSVTFSRTIYNELPFKFEAGTPDIAGAIGLRAAIDYIKGIGLENIDNYERSLVKYALSRFVEIRGLRLIGEAPERTAVISFLVDDFHPYDLGELLDKMSIAVRTGHHCCQPVMDQLHIPGTVRASFAFYNTFAEVDYLVASIERALKILRA